MSTFPVKPIRKPLSLRTARNGYLPAKVLETVKPDCTLHIRAARAWAAMRAAAKKDGVLLGHVGDYRPYDQQRALFLARFDDRPTGRTPAVTRSWAGKTWWLKPGMAVAAVPGTSNHGWGLAVDAALIIDGKTVTISADPDGPGPMKSGVAWLLKNADRFGWCWEIASGPLVEPWHIIYYAGSRTPKAVKAHEG